MANPATRTEIESVDYEERARVALMAATKRIGGPYGSIAARLAETLRDLGTLRMRDMDRTEFAHIELCIAGVISDLCPGIADINHIRRVRSHLDREDDRLTDLRAIDGPHVVSNRELAAAYRNAAAANLDAARHYEQLDREERRQGTFGVNRLRATAPRAS
jgi:hypothetical protein